VAGTPEARGDEPVLAGDGDCGDVVALSRPAVFLDKDGTLIEDDPYNIDPARMRFAPGADEGLRLLQSSGHRLFVVSNQSGVARGLFDEAALHIVGQRLRDMFAAAGARLEGFYYCPHHPRGSVPEYAQTCTCRKPGPGLLIAAARHHRIDLGRSWMVGDILDDVEAGRRAGCRTVLINNGHESEWVVTDMRKPLHTVSDLAEGARVIAFAQNLGQASQVNGT
jgi:D-glycero-D-manno-heptose 1,7-bisphosphate phosphatase